MDCISRHEIIIRLYCVNTLQQCNPDTMKLLVEYLYYYSSPCPRNLSSTFDEHLAARSQIDSDHRVNFYASTCCISATFMPPLLRLSFVFTTKIIINFATFCDILLCNCCVNRWIAPPPTTKNYAQLRTNTPNYEQWSIL